MRSNANMDLVVASPNGGLYAPTLQSLIHSTLERVKTYLASLDDFELRPSASPVRTGGTPTGAGQEG